MESTWNYSPTDTKEDPTECLCQLKENICIAEENRPSRDCGETKRENNGTLLFQPVTEADIPVLTDFFAKHPSRSCDYSIAGILMWTQFFNYAYALTAGSLFIKGRIPETGKAVYYTPLGNMNPSAALSLILHDAASKRENPIIVSPEESTFEEYKEIFLGNPSYKDEWKEYLYGIEQFTGFKGKKMEKKRNHLNYFEKHYPDYKIEVLTPGMSEEIEEFTRMFEDNHADSALFRYEAEKTLDVIRNYAFYPFDGIVIRLDGKIIGYTFGEKIGDTFFVHVEKGDYNYNGVYQALASHLARRVAEKYPDVEYLNREEDMGEETLRKSKESYHPCKIINKRANQVSFL